MLVGLVFIFVACMFLWAASNSPNDYLQIANAVVAGMAIMTSIISFIIED